MYNYEAGAQYLYGGVERLRANILVSEVAYADASKRAAKDSSIAAAAAGMSLARAVKRERRNSPLADLSID
jgi:hypothetical protein